MDPTHETIIGFDGTADDTSLVVMSRTPGGQWQVEHTDGPDAGDLAAMLDAAIATTPAHRGLAQQAVEWLNEHLGDGVKLDATQRALIERLYSGDWRPRRFCP